MVEIIESPCVKVCAIDGTTGWCLGCGRSMAEIASWSTLAPERRRAVMAEVDARKVQWMMRVSWLISCVIAT